MALPQFAGGRPCYRPKTKAAFYLLRFASYYSIFEMPSFKKISVLLLTSFLRFSEVSAIADSADDYRIQAEQGDAKAQAFLGYSFASGEGVPKDAVEAVTWSRKAAEQGDPMAQTFLGDSYAKGEGVPKDMVEAVKWYRKAAEQGDLMAQIELANYYASGEGVPKDEVEAEKWYRKAAEQGACDPATPGAQFERAEGVIWKISPPPPNSPEKSESPIPESQPPLRQD